MREDSGKSDQSIKWIAKEWGQWLSDRLDRRLATFRNEPEEMIGAFERERSYIDDYRGREILELLQNADDAGVGYGDNRAMIRWWREGVCVANSGLPFSAEGVASLIVGNVSPKKLDRTRYIGNRGLGFRSVLAWTNCPFILSGNLRLAFSPTLARASLKKLTTESEEVRQKVNEWMSSGHERPMPIFACPTIIGTKELKAFTKDLRWQRMWRRATRLISQFDTVIALPFTEMEAIERSLEQTESLEPELVLFLRYLKEIVIIAPNRKTTWITDRKPDSVSVRIEPNASEPVKWKVFQETGLIPDRLLTPGQKGTPSFEIQIAVCEDATEPGFLYNYFPTNVRFPYPVVAHVTMELTSNRQNLIESSPNRFLAKKLAEAIAEVAERSADPARPWQALKLIATRGVGVDPVLDRLGFEDELLRAIRRKKIIPRRDGVFVSPVHVKTLRVDTEGWLPLRRFRDIVLWTDVHSLKSALEWLQIEDISVDDFRTRIDKLSPSLTIKERAALLVGLVRNRQQRFVPKEPSVSVLIDESNSTISTSTPAYLPPSTEISFDMPPWMSVSFVSRELVARMLEILGYSRDRLVEELRETGFKNVHEYDFRGVARAIVSQINRRCKEESQKSDEIRLEGIRALRSLWLAAGGQDAPTKEEFIRIELPTRQNEWKKANELYIGAPYPKGVLMEVLLGGLHPELFVNGPEAFDHGSDTEDWQDFLLWLGVADLPHEKTVTCDSWNSEDYLEYVSLTARYPIKFDEFTVPSPKSLTLYRVHVASIEHISEIIENADPHAILAWIAIDRRFVEWSQHGDTNAKLEGQFRVYTYRTSSHPVTSYALWLLHTKGWLPSTNGKKVPPIECILARTVGEEIQSIFPRPLVNSKSGIFKELQVDSQTLNQALMTIGVRLSLDDITREQCYDLMLRLPEIDPDGEAAPRVYRLISEKRDDDEPSFASQVREQEFKESGKLWACKDNDCSYIDVSDGIYFQGDSTIPSGIVEHFPVIQLPKRRGSEKISRVFGVKVLRARDIQITIDQFDEVQDSEILNDELQRLKPYVLALRLDATPTIVGLARFNGLSIVPCSRVIGSARVDSSDIAISVVESGDSVIVADTAYLIVPSYASEPFLQDLMIARYVANILSDVLDVERSSDFASLALAKDHETRKHVLSDMLGHDAEEILAQARMSLEMDLEEDSQPGPSLEPFMEEPVDHPPIPPEHEPTDEDDSFPSEGETKVSPIPEQIDTEENKRDPDKPTETVKRRRVSIKKSKGTRVQKTHRVTDGDRCEELAERFEESQGRLPIRVGGLQGAEGYGCDLLSFSAEGNREKFIESNGNLIELVQRFIEVKGRSTQKGTIPLEGNQLRAARKYRQRYYMYRIYEAIAGQEWEVVELVNPVDHDWPTSYAVDPFQCPATRYWTATALGTNSES